MKLQLTLDQVNALNNNIEPIKRALDLLGLCIVDMGDGLLFRKRNDQEDCYDMYVDEKPRKGRVM